MGKTNISLRMKKILELLAGREEIAVGDMADRFQVATMTIRRDLETLEQQGLIIRTHGGAILTAPSVVAFQFHSRQQSHMAEKRAIAKAAVRLVKPGMTIILDTGTTTLGLAHALGGLTGIKVLTSSLAIASALLTHGGIELVLLGGTASKNSPDLSGQLTEANLATFRAHIVFIGADAVDKHGLYTNTQQIAQVTRAMIASSEKVVLVADSSKFGRNAFASITGWKDIDMLFVDDGLDAQSRKWIKNTVRNHTLVPTDIRKEA